MCPRRTDRRQCETGQSAMNTRPRLLEPADALPTRTAKPHQEVLLCGAGNQATSGLNASSSRPEAEQSTVDRPGPWSARPLAAAASARPARLPASCFATVEGHTAPPPAERGGGSHGTSACRTGLASARPCRALAVTLGPCSAATGQHRAVTRHSMTPPESWEVGCNVPVTFPT